MRKPPKMDLLRLAPGLGLLLLWAAPDRVCAWLGIQREAPALAQLLSEGAAGEEGEPASEGSAPDAPSLTTLGFEPAAPPRQLGRGSPAQLRPDTLDAPKRTPTGGDSDFQAAAGEAARRPPPVIVCSAPAADGRCGAGGSRLFPFTISETGPPGA
jgi:hypothetical protein